MAQLATSILHPGLHAKYLTVVREGDRTVVSTRLRLHVLSAYFLMLVLLAVATFVLGTALTPFVVKLPDAQRQIASSIAVLLLFGPLILSMDAFVLMHLARGLFRRSLAIHYGQQEVALTNVPLFGLRFPIDRIIAFEILTTHDKGNVWAWLVLRRHGIPSLIQVAEVVDRVGTNEKALQELTSLGEELAQSVKAPFLGSRPLSVWETLRTW